MWLIAVLFIPFFSTIHAEDSCFDRLQWSTRDSQIFVNGQPLVLKGINYNGFQTNAYSPDGLNDHSLDDILDFIKANDFNAIRIPFSMEMIRDNPYATRVHCEKNAGLCGATATRLLDVLILKAADRGLLVLLSNEQFDASVEILTTQFSLWYDKYFSEDTVVRIWQALISRYRDYWNVFALDLKNEPDHFATWGNTSDSTDWNKAAERMITRMRDFPGLFFVDGRAWGAELRDARKFPIDTGISALNNRVVYSPKCFGPSVYYRYEFDATEFPEIMDSRYMEEYGFLPEMGKTVVIGQWGARKAQRGDVWAAWYAEWMRRRCMTNNFYWSVSPNNGVIGGILEEDWKTPSKERLDMLRRVQPEPTKFMAQAGKICITKGAFPEPHCRRS